MARHLDYLRSLVRRAADRTRDLAAPPRALDRLRSGLRDLGRQAIELDERHVAGAIAQVRDITELSVSIQRGAVRVEAMRGEVPLSFSLIPVGAFFAPRGPKELRFRVEPSELATDGRVLDAVASLGSLLAGRLWAPILRKTKPGPALVDRDRDLLSVDLASVPEARRARTAGSALSMAFEVFEADRIEAANGALRLELRLPSGLPVR